ncbi:MAG: antitoxin [Caldilineaceae bacterium]|nr:antitoxin [Caldilineaceae bacterium]
MRLTLTIDDDVLALARTLADYDGCSLESANSELARRGSKGIETLKVDEDIPSFRVAPDAEPVTDEDVRTALSDWP